MYMYVYIHGVHRGAYQIREFFLGIPCRYGGRPATAATCRIVDLATEEEVNALNNSEQKELWRGAEAISIDRNQRSQVGSQERTRPLGRNEICQNRTKKGLWGQKTILTQMNDSWYVLREILFFSLSTYHEPSICPRPPW